MDASLVEAISRATDEHLFEMLHLNRAEYSAEGIAAAEAEFQSREFSPTQLQEFQEAVDQKKKLAIEPLSPFVKVLALFFGFFCLGVPLIILAFILEIAYREADVKRREARQWMGYGVAAAITSVIVVLLISFGTSTFQ